jgi:CspA family cold shock protein
LILGGAATHHLAPRPEKAHIQRVELALVRTIRQRGCADIGHTPMRALMAAAIPLAAQVILGELRMATGTVKWFNSQKGYGFIQPDEGGNDVFVHISAVERAGLSNLREGQKISYEIERGRNGKSSAVNLRVD